MIEVEWGGPRLRGLGVMLAATLTMVLVYVSVPHPEVLVWEGWGFVAVVAVGAVVQVRDAVRWRRQGRAEEHGGSGGGGDGGGS